MQVNALLALGRTREAGDEEGRILEERPPLAHIYTLLGILHLTRGEAPEATRLFRRALELSPAEPTARDGLRRATGGA